MKHTKAGFFHPAIALNRLYLVYILRVLNAWNCQQLFSVSNTNRFYRTLCNLWTLLEAECKNDMCAEWNGEYVNRFDSIRYLSCPMQCTRNLGCFPRGNRAGVVRHCPIVFPEWSFFRVFIPPAAEPTLLRQMHMGCLTCAQIWVRVVHTKGDQAQTRLHKSWLGGTEKLCLTLPRQGIEPSGFGFEFRRTNHWATSLVS